MPPGRRCYIKLGKTNLNINMGIQTISISLIIITISALVIPVQSQVITPDSALTCYIAEALKNNPKLVGWQDRIEAASARVPQAGAWSDPMLELSLMNLPVNNFDFNQEPMTTAKVMIGQMVPLAGKSTLCTEIARYNLETTRSGRQAQELMVTEKLAQVWYDWAFLQEALRTLDRNIDLLDDLIAVTSSKYGTGRGMLQDILRAETRRMELEDRRVGLRQMILTTGRRIAALVGREPDTSIQPPQSLTDHFTVLDIDELTTLMFERNPTWQGMEAKLTASKSRVELARLAWWPDLKLGVAYSYRQDAKNGMERPDFFTVTAGISIPLYKKRKQGAAAQEMLAMQRATASEQLALELDLRLKLEKLLDEDRRLEEQIRLYREGVEPHAEATLTASTTSYSVGKVDFEALLMAETALYNAQLERLARIRDRLHVRAALAALIGGDDLIPDNNNK